MSYLSKIVELTSQLYPTGRAFKAPVGGNFEKLKTALAQSESRAYADAISIQNSILPDNDGFTAADATQWEVRLGLITNTALSLATRKSAIIRKMNHPGTIKPRQNWRYIQAYLRSVGFDVYIYENRFPDGMGGYVTQSPVDFSDEAFPITGSQLGDDQLGDFQLGAGLGNQIVNSIYQSIDNVFSIGGNFKSTFFIGGATPGSWANVPSIREIEFRELILRLKPRQTVGFLLIHYI